MSIFPLRDYQDFAVTAVKNWIKYKPDHNGYVKAAGGAGKSVMIAATAEYCFDAGKRIVMLARSEKLLTQNKAKFAPQYQQHIGLYCSGLGEKDLSKPITIASIQSIADKQLDGISTVIIDEVQNLSNDEESDTQYWNFIRGLGKPQIIGFTATDFRTASGKLNFGQMICDIPTAALIEKGYLIPPVNKASGNINFDNVQIIRGEYNNTQLEEIYTDPTLLAKTIEILMKYTADRHSCVLFCQSRKHGAVLQQAMADNGMEAMFVDGDTDKTVLNTEILPAFDRREFKYLINVALLIEGWDCPSIDCVVILMKTESKTKFEQMLYRGTRLAPHLNKTNFLVVDMGGNFQQHGGLGSPYREKGKKESISEAGRVCPECENFIPAPYTPECACCGYLFPESDKPKVDHNHNPDTDTRTVYNGDIEEYQVMAVSYKEHKSKKGNMTLKVSYHSPQLKYGSVSKWYSPHSDSEWARGQCAKFFRDAGHPLCDDPKEYDFETLLWHCSQCNKPQMIVVDHAKEFPEIVKVVYSKLALPAPDIGALLEDEIPF